MRSAPTPAERILRHRLTAAGIHFTSQQVIGRYIVDIVLPQYMTVVELDGIHHRISPKQRRYDQERDEYLTSLGLLVLRIPNYRAETYPLPEILQKGLQPKHAFRGIVKSAKKLPYLDRRILQEDKRSESTLKTYTVPLNEIGRYLPEIHLH